MVRRLLFSLGLVSALGFAPGTAQAGTFFDSLLAKLQSKAKTASAPKAKTVVNAPLALRTTGILGTSKAAPAANQTLKRSTVAPFGPGRTTTNKPKTLQRKRFIFPKPNLPKPGRR